MFFSQLVELQQLLVLVLAMVMVPQVVVMVPQDVVPQVVMVPPVEVMPPDEVPPVVVVPPVEVVPSDEVPPVVVVVHQGMVLPRVEEVVEEEDHIAVATLGVSMDTLMLFRFLMAHPDVRTASALRVL